MDPDNGPIWACRDFPIASSAAIVGAVRIAASRVSTSWAAYLTDRLGVFVEPVFFACFSLVVAVELFEPALTVVPV
jgi:hypothetical protein